MSAPRCHFDVSPVRQDDASSAVFATRVPPDLVYLRGHFEGAPVLPGVVQLQSLVLDLVERAWPAPERTLARVSQLKFRRPVRPGDELVVTLRRAGEQVTFVIVCGDRTCSTGTLDYGAPR